MIKRELYLRKMRAFQDKPFLKVITGIRRCGKSTLLKMFREQLLESGVPAEAVVYRNFEILAYPAGYDYRQMHDELAQIADGKSPVYFLLDEVQQIEHWEKAINSLFAAGVADIYITGSNAWLLSSELATLISGRYVEIRLLPLSFGEYYSFFAETGESRGRLFQKYLKYGGMPAVASMLSQPDTVEMVLSGIYNTVMMNDVVERNSVRDAALLAGLVRYLADNAGNLVSSTKISNYLGSAGRKTSSATIDNYLQMLEKAFIFYRAGRYDIKGKAYLKTQEKYYIVDTGLRNYLLGFRNADYGRVLENVVYLELIRRGYSVQVGRVNDLEVDFVAVSPEEKLYCQVAASVLDEATLERELRPLRLIPDQYPKLLLTMDDTFVRDFDGIKNLNIVDWLLA